MDLAEFDFELPEELIALRPVRPRSASRMLVSEPGAIHDRHFSDLPDWLAPGDMLVFNDSRVIPARLFGRRHRAGSAVSIEVLLIERLGADRWRAMARPARRLAPGDRVAFSGLDAEILARDGGEVELGFAVAGDALDRAIARTGVMPLPPYIAGRRPADARDVEDYQSVFAARPGAIAAPTASLHFDTGLMERLAARGILSTRLTLHVGAGTFLPVKGRIDEHRMHGEWGEIGAEAAAAMNAARAAGGRLIPAGTTALRLIESAAEADGRIRPWQGETDIFIKPGYRFRATDGLVTNFHLPKSTLVMLVAALIGIERLRAVYAHAIAARYRFYSYGDGSLLWPAANRRTQGGANPAQASPAGVRNPT